jgi:hypothetical protein
MTATDPPGRLARLREPIAEALRGQYPSDDLRPSYRATDAVLAKLQSLLCSCDADPIECGHEAARGQAEEELRQAKAEIEQLRYERRLLGAARMVLDLVAAGGPAREEQARREAEDLSQRIVDEIGHPVTDEPALGPSYRVELAEAKEENQRLLARLAEYENAEGWGTSCTSCARVLDASVAEYGRAERAKEMLHLVGRIVATSSRDWAQHASDAWLYGLLVGWDQDGLEEVAQRFGWTERGVAKLLAQREAIIGLEGPPGATEEPEPLHITEPRELVGRLVRQVWVEWARERPDAKPSWLLPWEDLDDGQREVDMRIGAALFGAGRRAGIEARLGEPEGHH